MESVLGRYRNLIILVAVLFVQVLGLAMQVKRVGNETTHDTRLIRIWVVGAVTPLERGLFGFRTAPAISGTTIFISAACAQRTANSRRKSSRCGWSRCV